MGRGGGRSPYSNCTDRLVLAEGRGGLMKPVTVLDVAGLPDHAFGHRSILWWGTLGFMATEGMAFALAAATYLYLSARVPEWPPDVPPPNLGYGIANLIVLLLSVIPNYLAKHAAEEKDLRGVRLWIVVCLLFAAVFLVLRGFEFTSLNVRWDLNAYGSIQWTILGLHTTHLITDIGDTAVLAVLMFTGPISGRRFVDVSENSFYWYFVVGSWLPLYALVYWGPRLL
jgi:cytochrome c oxidase subunit I+III